MIFSPKSPHNAIRLAPELTSFRLGWWWLERVIHTTVRLELGELGDDLVKRNRNTAVLRGRVVTVSNIDHAAFGFFGADDEDEVVLRQLCHSQLARCRQHWDFSHQTDHLRPVRIFFFKMSPLTSTST